MLLDCNIFAIFFKTSIEFSTELSSHILDKKSVMTAFGMVQKAEKFSISKIIGTINSPVFNFQHCLFSVISWALLNFISMKVL